MKKYLFAVVFCLPCFVLAQPSKLDSMLTILKIAKDDTAKVRLLLTIKEFYSAKDYDSFYYFLSKADTLSKKLKTNFMDFYVHTGYAEYYYYKNDYYKAIEHATKSKDIAEILNDQKLLAKSYNNLAAVNNHFGRHKNAIDCILKCLDVSEQTKDSISFPVRNLTASNTYYNLQQFQKAIEYAEKAIRYGRQFDNSYVILMGMNNKSASYSGLNMLDSSINISKSQLALAKRDNDVTNICYALINLCQDNFRLGNYPDLETYALELLTYSKKFPDELKTAEVNNSMAIYYISKQEFELASNQLDSGIMTAKNDEDIDALGNLYKMYAILYYTQGKFKEAEKYSYQYDSIIQVGNLQELNYYAGDMEVKYETEKKEAQIKLQTATIKQKSTLNYILIGAAVSLLVISLLSYRNYTHRQKLQQAKIAELETEKQLTATEAILKGEEQERSRLAKDLHDGLGGMLSGIKYSLNNMKENMIMAPNDVQAFEHSIHMLDSSISEMRRVAHNLMPESLLKFGLDEALNDFCKEISRNGMLKVVYQSFGLKDKSIDRSLSVTTYRIVQELLNNIIKHANAAQAIVQVSASEAQLTITVEDDGKAMDKDTLKAAQGIGWKNIRSRVDYHKGVINMQSEPGKGTSVFIEFPLV